MTTMISEQYLAEQAHLHATHDGYGVASMMFGEQVSEIINETGVTSLLDYGCGKGRLMKSLKVDHEVRVQLYDPSIEAYSAAPEPCEMVTCIDVLEHIEPEFLDNVLDDLQRLTQVVGFFTVHCGPAMKVLSDGRNAHLTQQPMGWWLPKFESRFDVFHTHEGKYGFTIVVLKKST